MAKKEFILQGFTERTHIDAVRRLFDVPEIKKVLLSVAFITESGVEKIENELRAHAAHLTVFAGIRNDITSHQALVRLLGIGGTLYTVDTGSWTRIFHPKLFLARGKAQARIVLGSANLTLAGLNNNIEAGMLLDFDLPDAADKAVVNQIENEFAVLPKEYPIHVVNVGSVAVLDTMLAEGRLADEAVIPPPRPKTSTGGTGSGDAVPLIKLKITPIYRVIAKVGTLPKKAAAAKSPSRSGGTLPVAGVKSAAYEPVWQSKPLSRRSLTIPTGKNSNPTGSTTLGKGLLNDIYPVTYFRKIIFGHLAWAKYTNRAGNPAERVNALFDLILKGKLIGTFTLTLRHSLTREAAAPKDKNLPTELSWNEARQFITRDDLIDRTMTLYRDIYDPKHFAVQID